MQIRAIFYQFKCNILLDFFTLWLIRGAKAEHNCNTHLQEQTSVYLNPAHYWHKSNSFMTFDVFAYLTFAVENCSAK